VNKYTPADWVAVLLLTAAMLLIAIGAVLQRGCAQ
jgi:hypothetical protein